MYLSCHNWLRAGECKRTQIMLYETMRKWQLFSNLIFPKAFSSPARDLLRKVLDIYLLWNHKWLKLEGTSGSRQSNHSAQRHLEPVAQYPVQTVLEYLPGWRLYKLPVPVPVLHYPSSEISDCPFGTSVFVPTAPCAVPFTGLHCKVFISCLCHGYYSHDGQRTWAKQELEAATICFIRPTGIVEKQDNNFLVNKYSQRIEIDLCRQIQSWLAVIYPQSAAVLLSMDCLGDWLNKSKATKTDLYVQILPHSPLSRCVLDCC